MPGTGSFTRSLALGLLLLPGSLAAGTIPNDPGRVLSLDGAWSFRTDPEGSLDVASATRADGARTIRVPGAWEARFPDLVDYDGVAWYWRTVAIPASWKGSRIALQFDAVDYLATVYVNGREVGRHEGGYTPFAFQVRDALRLDGRDTIAVRVLDPAKGPAASGALQVRDVPAGKQGHYCNIGGIWQHARIVRRPPSYIDDLHILADPRTGDVRARVRIAHPADGAARLTVAIAERGGAPRWRLATELPPRAERAEPTIRIPDPRPWSPSSPNLYRLDATLEVGGERETLSSTFGFRTIEARDGRLLLDGKPIIFRAALDQAFYPDDIYAAGSEDFYARQFRLARELGLNGMRTHIKIPTPGYIDAADRLGILLWIDFPSWFRFTDATDRRARRQMREWILRDRNHPSIIAWCLINEEWGLNMRDAARRAWLRSWWEEVKALDPTRLVVDNSPAGGGHVISDIADQHAYFAIPDQLDRALDWIDALADSRRERFPHPDSRMRGFEPLVWSEFGDWGLPDVEKLLAYYGGRDPYWFDQPSYGGPIRGGIARFEEYGIAAIYGGFPALARATQLHEGEALKVQIERLRRHGTIAGYVITQWSDLNSESNGLVDMCRHPKAFHGWLRHAQADVMIFADADRRNVRSGEEVELRVFVSNFGPEPIDRASVICSYSIASSRPGYGGRVGVGLSCKGIACGEGREIGRTRLRLDLREILGPDAPLSARKVRIGLRLKRDERELARNFLDLWVFPRMPRVGERIAVDGSVAPELREALAKRHEIAGRDEGKLLVAADLDPSTLGFVRAGGRVLLLGDRGVPGAAGLAGLRISTNRGELGRGWIQPHWFIRRDGPLGSIFRDVPYEGHLGMAFARCLPRGLIRGLDPRDFARLVVVGGFAAWCHDPAAACAALPIGKGIVLFYGLDTAACGDDPMATLLLDRAIEGLARIDRGALPELAVRMMGIVSPTAETGPVRWRYTTREPPAGWEAPDFDDRGWKTGRGPFGKRGTPGIRPRTAWTTPAIWLRRGFDWDGEARSLLLRIYHDEDCEVYLNGRRIARRKGYLTGYAQETLPAAAREALRRGRNVLAVHCRQTAGGQGIDVGILAETE